MAISSLAGSVEIDTYKGALALPSANASFTPPSGVSPIATACVNFPAGQTILSVTEPIPSGLDTVVVSAYSGTCGASDNLGTGSILNQLSGSGNIAAPGDLAVAVFGVTSSGPVSLSPVLVTPPASFTSGDNQGAATSASSSSTFPPYQGSINQSCFATGSPTQTYVNVASAGTITNGTFIPSATAFSPAGDITSTAPGTWAIVSYEAHNSTDGAGPTPVPQTTPTPTGMESIDAYSGTLTLSNGQKTCYGLISFQYGFPLTGNDSITAIGQNVIAPPSGYDTTGFFPAEGSVGGYLQSFSLTNIGQGGNGSGSVALDNGLTGTIAITDFATTTAPYYIDSLGDKVLETSTSRLPQTLFAGLKR